MAPRSCPGGTLSELDGLPVSHCSVPNLPPLTPAQSDLSPLGISLTFFLALGPPSRRSGKRKVTSGKLPNLSVLTCGMEIIMVDTSRGWWGGSEEIRA